MLTRGLLVHSREKQGNRVTGLHGMESLSLYNFS